MAGVRAAVLAAGRGVRMKAELPKSLLPIGEEEPLLHYILGGLHRSGVDDLIVVTGHRSQDVIDFVTERWGGAKASFVFNARYASWGNFHSLRMALDQSPGLDVLAVNSDVVVHPDVFRRVVDQPGELVLAVEQRRNLDLEDMRVELKGDVVRAIGKHIKRPRSHGEFCGVSLIRPPAARAYLDVATDLEWRSDTSGYYEDVYAAILERIDCRGSFVEPGEYAEVDRPEDMAAAAEVVERHRDAWAQAQSPAAD